jgi:hypothetical protein
LTKPGEKLAKLAEELAKFDEKIGEICQKNVPANPTPLSIVSKMKCAESLLTAFTKIVSQTKTFLR